MAQCEDYPCCGHQSGECPTYDKNGKLLCICGADLPKYWKYSICPDCMKSAREQDGEYDE